MAEFVQLRKEKWVEPLYHLEKLELLTKQELRSVIFTVGEFENKIQSQTRKLEDILAYIQFKCDLLLKLKEVRKSRNQYDLTEEIDRFIYNEIRSQFGSAEINFTHNVDFWNAKLRFVANIVPDQDKENEFNRVFKKMINYCGRADLEVYKNCVDYLWTFVKRPQLTANPKKRRKASTRRDVSKLMGSIRNFTKEAIRNFPRNPDASIWLLITELKYLELLREEEEIYNENPKIPVPFSIEDEVEKSERLIGVIYRNLVAKHAETPSVYIKLYEAIRLLPLLEARQLSKKVYSHIIGVKHRTPEMIDWLLGRSIDENKTEEFIERVNQALSSSHPKHKMLELCTEKINCFIEKLVITRDPENRLPQLLDFYTHLLHKDNPEWNQVSSEALHKSRIHIIKKLSLLMESLPKDNDDVYLSKLQSFQSEHNPEETIKHFVKKFPSSFVLVKERILQILSQTDEDKVKPSLICRYLDEVNWKLAEDGEGLKFLQFVYYSFITLKKLSKESKLDLFLKISPSKIPEMNEIRLLHLKKMYIEDLEHGRDFYMRFRILTSDWRFASEVVRIETTACKDGGKQSKVLLLAYEDALRLAGLSAIEPWKTCIMSKLSLRGEKEASALMQRALKLFSGEKKTSWEYEELLLFSQKLAVTSSS